MVQFNTKWLSEWIQSDSLSVDKIHNDLVSQGLENEIYCAALSASIIVGEVLTCEPHPKSSKLSVTTVDVGEPAPLTIVCGCPTVKSARKVCVAKVGAHLGDIEIAERSICGLTSYGMLCSLSELGIGGAQSGGICHLSNDATVGMAVSEWLRSAPSRLDIEVTMNRGDCMSVRGVAREIAIGQTLVLQEPWQCSLDSMLSLPPAQLAVTIAEDAQDACSALYVLHVDRIDLSKRTPDWMAIRLRESGLGLHNIVVDVLHYVMLETGQPFHAYDAAKVVGGLHVGFAKQGAVLASLQGDDLILDAQTLIVADDNAPHCVAGYMGDKQSAVSDTTTAIYLEAACFSAQQSAYHCRKFPQHTQSGSRFERGVDFGYTQKSLARAMSLLQTYAAAQPVGLSSCESKVSRPKSVIKMQTSYPAKILGYDIDDQDLRAVLLAVGCQLEDDHNGLLCTVPSWRGDMVLPQHLVSEYLRFRGVKEVEQPTVSATLSTFSSPDETSCALADVMRAHLVSQGSYEAFTYNFIDRDVDALFSPDDSQSITLRNPLGKSYATLRSSILPGLLVALARNQAHGEKEVSLHEMGRVYSRDANSLHQPNFLSAVFVGRRAPERWQHNVESYDFFATKGLLAWLFESISFSKPLVWQPTPQPGYHPRQSGVWTVSGKTLARVGVLHPAVSKRFGLQGDVCAWECDFTYLSALAQPERTLHAVSKYPSIRRDLSLLVPESLSYADIYEKIQDSVKMCLKNVVIFDIYSGNQVPDGFYSISLGLVFQSDEASLKDEQVAASITQLLDDLASTFHITVRGS